MSDETPQLTNLGAVTEVITKGTTPTTIAGSFTHEGTAFIKVETIDTDGGIVAEKLAFIDSHTHSLLKRSQLKEHDVLFSIAGVIGRTAIIKQSMLPANTNQAIAILRPKIGLLDPQFLYYYLRSPHFLDYSLGRVVQTAQANVSLSELRIAPIKLPHMMIQRKIAAILSAYDDLIENNTRRIKILEETAQTIYREWFVNFRFPGHQEVRLVNSELGKIPEGWNILNLFDIAEVTYGFPFKSRLFSSRHSGLPVVRIRDINLGYSSTYTPEEVDSKYILENGDILVGMDGNFNMVKWAGGVALLNQRVVRFRPKAAFGRYHLYLALKAPIHFFDSTVVGTTVAHLSDEDLRSIDLPLPRSNDTKLIYDTFEPLLDLEINLRMKNTLLRQARDLLLPHLISGELDVSDFDIVINGSGGN